MADIVSAKKQEIASARKKFGEAVEKKDLYFVEIIPDLKDLETKGSVLQKMPKDNTELELYRSWVKSVKSLKKKTEDHRLDATGHLDVLKTNMIAEQRDLFVNIDPIEQEVTKFALLYVQEVDRKKKEDEARVIREKNKAIEVDVLKEKIKNSATTALSEEILKLNRLFSTSWAALTLSDFDSRIQILKGYKPKVEYAKILTYFNYNYQFITPDEFEGLLRQNFDFEKFETEMAKAIENTKQQYLAKADGKKKELQDQTESDRLKLINDNNDAEVRKQAQLLIDQNKREEQLKEKAADIKLEIESNTVTVMGGSGLKNISHKQVAVITGAVDWNKIINIWISDNGTEKLKFLLLNLKKKGCPEIDGITYKEETGVIFK